MEIIIKIYLPIESAQSCRIHNSDLLVWSIFYNKTILDLEIEDPLATLIASIKMKDFEGVMNMVVVCGSGIELVH